MKAIRVHEFGGPHVLKVESDVPVPSYSDSQVNIYWLVNVLKHCLMFLVSQ